MIRRILWSFAVLALSASVSRAETGNPNLKSIQAMTFGPNGVLILGDGAGSQVVAVETGDLTGKAWSKKEIPNITDVIAGKLGGDAKAIQIIRLAVNPASNTAYVAVKHLPSKKDVVLTINGEGTVAELNLEKVNFQRYSLATGDKSTVTRITDLTHAGDRILVAVSASEAFASKIYSIITKPDIVPVSFGTETYHVAHRNWETKAPIRAVIPYEQDGKRYLIGAFTCTPIVKFALDEMQPEGKVKGASIIELGSGNEPRDMFVYEKGGKKYILMSSYRFHHAKNPVGPNPNWAVRVDYDLLREATNINDKALWRVQGKANEPKTDRAIVAEQYFGVLFMDRLDSNNALVVLEGKGQPSLNVLPLP